MLQAKRLWHDDDHSSAEAEKDRSYMPSWLAEGQAYFYCVLILIIITIILITNTTTIIIITVGHLKLTVR
jgi:hypothetical protein